jgi:glucokinase
MVRLETFFSSKAIESEAAAMLHRGLVTSLRAPATCADVFAAARAGDAAAGSIVERAVAKLAGAVAGLFLALDPEVLILGGQIAAAGDVLLGPLRDEIRRRTYPMLRREVPVVPTQIADGTGLVGAAALVLAARLQG